MGDSDHERAARERQARRRLADLGAAELTPRRWRPPPMPPSDVELLQFATSRSAGLERDDLRAALALLPAAHAELSALEAGLLFSARAAGITWAEIAEAMGLRSAQAAHQRAGRLRAGGTTWT